MKQKLTILLIVMLAIPVESPATTIKLNSFQNHEEEENYLLDAAFAVELGDEVLEALQHGIPLQIITDLEVRLVRNWYPDKLINAIRYSYQLSHQPLTEDYLTVNLITGLRESYDSLSAALTNIGRFSHVKLVNKQTLSTDSEYIGRLRMYLDLDSLPAPMRPQVYFSREWNVSSAWHEWLIQK